MALREKIIFVIVSIVVLILFFRFLRRLIRFRTYISNETKNHADKVFGRLIHQFKATYKREPNRDELFRGVLETSHIVEKRKGARGHFARQRIRKYLLEKNRIVRKYNMK